MSRPVTKTMQVPWIAWVLFAVAMAGLVALFSAIANFGTKTRPHRFEAPDEVQAARELLASKFSGPRYFQIGEPAEGVPYPCIPVESARRQVAGIIALRQLPAGTTAEIEKIISKLTQRAVSRVIGTDHVNVLQLNLALDELK